ncbi:MAG: PKD domain-containing protein, partial [Thermoplasmata archaeon]|nr:PKD domain-containing protein [Thermoplasmata archaeon]NIU48687.1 PKD domain-containing protein [Thermoplasmata archaeon]NIY03098.1 PKD domain-containing protein [Thermoplasmata archaeon]
MLSRSLGTVAFACLLAAALLMVTEDASAGDEDFFGVEGKPIALNVTVDPGGPVTKWWWDFEGDGCFTWSSSVGPNTTHVYEEPGVYYPVLKAMWGNVTQGTWIYQALVEPDNEPPVITLIGDYESGWRFYPLHIEGVALDNDGEVVLYEWDFDGDGVFDWNSTEGGAVQHEFTELGNFTGVLRVTDDDGATTSRTTLFIIKNLPPVIDRANDVEFSP